VKDCCNDVAIAVVDSDLNFELCLPGFAFVAAASDLKDFAFVVAANAVAIVAVVYSDLKFETCLSGFAFVAAKAVAVAVAAKAANAVAVVAVVDSDFEMA